MSQLTGRFVHSRGKPSLPAAAWAVARVTFTEILREKVLYNVILAAFLLFAIGVLTSKLTFIQPERVVRDFGFSALNVSSTFLAILVGAGMVGKEMDRRTILVALSHPISPLDFVVGKFLGLATILLVNWGLLSGVYLLMLQGLSGQVELSFTLISALLLILIQSLVIGSIAVLFSCFTTASLAVILSIGQYLVGINNSELRLIAEKVKSPVGKNLLELLAALLPNMENFNLAGKLTYDLPVTSGFVLTGVAYGVAMTVFCLFCSGALIRLRGL